MGAVAARVAQQTAATRGEIRLEAVRNQEDAENGLAFPEYIQKSSITYKCKEYTANCSTPYFLKALTLAQRHAEFPSRRRVILKAI
jgi:hypothetical protein